MSALATAIVLYEGDPGIAVESVARDAHQPSWLLEPVRLSSTTTGPRVELVGAPPGASCAAPTRAAAVFASVSRTEPLVAAASWEAARTELAAATASVACLVDPIEASIAARLYLLDGVVYTSTGDVASAERSYAQALALQPGMSWDAALPATAREPFDKAAAPHPVVHVGVGVADPSSVFVDGRPAGAGAAGFDVAAGPHVLQVIGPVITTLVVDLAVGDSRTLQVVTPLDDAAVTRTDDPAVREAILATTSRSHPGRAVFVWTGHGVIDATNGWAPVPAARTPLRLGEPLLLGGALVTAVGVVGTTYAFTKFSSKIAQPEGETPTEMADRFIAGGRAGGATSIGVAILVEGIVAMGVGLPLALHDGRVRVAVAPTGAMVTVGGKP